MGTDELDEYRKERQTLKRLASQIKTQNDHLEDLYEARKQEWRRLDNAGVKRSVIAKWSAVDPILITRALAKR